jgi:hypothetical protein
MFVLQMVLALFVAVAQAITILTIIMMITTTATVKQQQQQQTAISKKKLLRCTCRRISRVLPGA